MKIAGLALETIYQGDICEIDSDDFKIVRATSIDELLLQSAFVVMSREDFDKLIDDAYDRGYEQARYQLSDPSEPWGNE